MIALLVLYLMITVLSVGIYDFRYMNIMDEVFTDYKTLTYKRLLIGLLTLHVVLIIHVKRKINKVVSFKKISNLLDNNIFK